MVRYNFADKRVKHCEIAITGYKSSVFSLQSTSKVDNKAVFTGAKNKVLKELKVFLKEQNVPKATLSKIMDAVNNTSYCYKYSNKDRESVDIKAFNEFTGIFYNIRIEYNLSRLLKVAPKNKVNRRGENIFEKRLCQSYGASVLLSRYKEAKNTISFYKLSNVITKPAIQAIKDSVECRIKSLMFGDDKLVLNVRTEIIFKLTEDIEIMIYLKPLDRHCNMRGNEIELRFDVVGVRYKDVYIKELEDITVEPTEEVVEEAEKHAKLFEEVYKIAKSMQ